MRRPNRELSIETDHTIHLSTSSYLSSTSELTFPTSSDPEISTVNSSQELSKLTTSQIAKKNHDIYRALTDRLEKRTVAITELELNKLKTRVDKLEELVLNVHQARSTPTKSMFESSQGCPPAPTHSLIKLKTKLKEAKYKKKMLKTERNEIGCELDKYKKVCKELRRKEDLIREGSNSRGLNSNPCNIF